MLSTLRPAPRRAAASLATVYVRQELGSAAEEPQPEQPRPEPVQDGREPLCLPAAPTMRLVVRPAARTVREALDGDDHLLVTGGPGQGKSSLSLRLAADIAAEWVAPTGNGTAPLAEPVVPLRLTAREYARCCAAASARTCWPRGWRAAAGCCWSTGWTRSPTAPSGTAW